MALTTIPVELVTLDDGVTITVDDNSDNLTLTSTDADANAGPNLRMYRNSSSPADSDALGLIEFEGRNDNTQDVVYAGIDSRIVDASDGTEDGRLEIVTMLAGTAGISRILMDATETVFNDNSKDLDFRIESDANANAFFLDAGGGMVGFNTNTPTSDSGWTGFIHLAHTTNNAIVLDGTDSQQAGIGAVDGLYIDCLGHTTATNNNIIFRTTSTNSNHSGTERMRITSAGPIGIGKEYVTAGVGSAPHGSLVVGNTAANDYAMSIHNIANSAAAYGMQMTAGANDGSGTTYYIYAMDGDRTGVGQIANVSGTFALADLSDERLKENIKDTEIVGIDRVKALKVREFNWKKSGEKNIAGFVAQELETVMPEVVITAPDDLHDEQQRGIKSISRDMMVPTLVKAMQEQQALIETLQTKVKALEEA